MLSASTSHRRIVKRRIRSADLKYQRRLSSSSSSNDALERKVCVDDDLDISTECTTPNLTASEILSRRQMRSEASLKDDYVDSQFQKPPPRIPMKSICLALFLCVAGTSVLIFGMLVLLGTFENQFADRIWPMLIMGFLMFIPGAYHVRLAVCAYKGIPGYSFDDMPEFD